MKKRLEDQLIELAFGDRHESGVAEGASTPEAAARLKEYRAMRSALGQLRELPEHQLSTERLREALLHQGLKRRRAFPWQALGYISAASSLFVCAYFVSRDVRRANAPTPRIYGNTASKPAAFDSNLPEYMFGRPSAVESPKVASIGEHHSILQPRAPRHFDVAYNTDERPIVRLTQEIHPVGKSDSGKAPTNSVTNTRGSDGNPAPVPASSHPASTSNAMLLIQSNTDADSGLDTAQEVTAHGDVLVGG